MCPALRPGQFSCEGLHVARGDELSQPRRPMTRSCEHRGHRSGDPPKAAEQNCKKKTPKPRRKKLRSFQVMRLLASGFFATSHPIPEEDMIDSSGSIGRYASEYDSRLL